MSIPALLRVFFLAVTIGLTASVSFAGMQFNLAPRLSVSEEYTDNLFLADEDKEAEWISIVSPGISLNGQGKTTNLSLNYSTSYVYYSRYEESPPLRHNLNFNVRHQASPYLTLSFSDSYNYTDEPYSQNATAEGPDVEFIDRRGRETYYTNSAAVSANYRLGKHDTFSLSYRNYLREDREPVMSHDINSGFSHQFGKRDRIGLNYSYRRLTSDDPEIEESTKHNPSLDLDYWWSPRMGLESSVDYTRGSFAGEADDFDDYQGSLKLTGKLTKHLEVFGKYKHTYMDFQGEEVDYQVYDPSVGLDYAWTEDTFINMSVGYFYLDNEGGKEDEKGISLDGDIGKSWRFKRGSLSLTGGTGYTQDYFGSENLGFSIYQDVSFNGNYRITKRLTGTFAASYRRDDYVNREPERVDNSYDLSGGLSYSPVYWLRITLDESYRYMDSDDADQNYDENRIMLKITWTPRHWRLN